MHPVDSSNLDSVGYDVSTSTLRIKFHSGSSYDYYDVPERVYEDLLGAASVTKYFNAHVKWEFNYSKL